MSIRHSCSTVLTGGASSSYMIRHFVAISRAELHTTARLGALRHRPVVSRTSHIRTVSGPRPYSTERNTELLDTPWSLPDLPTSSHESASTSLEPASTSSEPASTSSEPASTTASSLPWYLRESSSSAAPPPLPRQTLPALPLSPPPLLSPLLSHLSTTLGIDDLSLFDLRLVDPPPALGVNLLMLLGTARSDKHLHVAADRLCRWLRSDHGLAPFADGLLGRNELKLARKRRAKKGRLLGAVGARATAAGQGDEGLRTGWVCVNIGGVEGGVLRKETEEEIVGFRTGEEGCRVVVQIMTEEMRGRLDLESLWTGIRNGSEAEEGVGSAAGEGRVGQGREASVREERGRSEQDGGQARARNTLAATVKAGKEADNPFPEAKLVGA